MDRRTRARRRARVRRRRLLVVLFLVALLVGALTVFSERGQTASSSRTPSSAVNHSKLVAGAPSIEAGVEPWPAGVPISRETVLVDRGQLIVMGGLSASGTSVTPVYGLDPSTGASVSVGSLAAAVHDGGGALLGSTA